MGTKYSSQSSSGYNSSPPPDDGTTVAANKITWATIKTKLPDVLKTFIEAVNSQLVNALDYSCSTTSVNYTTVAGDHQKPIQATGSITISLGDATTMAAGYQATVVNTGTGVITVGVITATDTLDGLANGTVKLAPGNSATFAVQSGALGYKTLSRSSPYIHGTDIASAATVNLDTATGDCVDVTGTVTITAITLQDGAERTVRFTGILTLTHGASLVLPGGASITTAAGDYAVFRGYAAGVVRCVEYTKASGAPVSNQGGIARNMVYNGSCRVLAEAAKNISTAAQYGKVDAWACWATGTAVSAGTVTQDAAATIGTYGKALHISGLTVTGTGIAFARQRIPASDAVFYKNKTCTFSATVLHDVGSSINYTVVIRKPTVSDNYGATTTIGTSSAQSVTTATGTQITFTQAMGDCSNGIEIEIQAACGAVTTKNFRFSDMQLEEGSFVTEFQQISLNLERVRCGFLFEKTYDQGTDPATDSANGIRSTGTPSVAAASEGLQVSFIYVKRTAPTVSTWDKAGNSAKYSTRNGGAWINNRGGLTNAQIGENGAIYDSGNTTDTSNAFYHYTADARL